MSAHQPLSINLRAKSHAEYDQEDQALDCISRSPWDSLGQQWDRRTTRGREGGREGERVCVWSVGESEKVREGKRERERVSERERVRGRMGVLWERTKHKNKG